MKKITSSLFICIALVVSLKTGAQNITPVQSTIEHNDKIRPCLLVKLDPEPKTLKNAWIDFVKHNYDFKLKGMGWFSNKDLLYKEEVTVEKLSTKKMNFYTYVVEDDNGSEMKVFASFGYDIYLDQEHYPEAYRAMEEMLNLFLKQYLPNYYSKAIEETLARIKDFEKEIKNLKEDIEDKTEDIKKLNKGIEKDKESIKDTTHKLIIVETKLKGRQKKLERVKAELEKL
jgi:hypothetical protein